MEKTFVSIGIDVSKDFLDIYGAGDNFSKRIANDAVNIAEFIKHCQSIMPDLLICEASGGYERTLVVSLCQANVPIAVVNARQVRDFAKAKGVLAKTDSIDAKIIAEYGTIFKPEPQMLNGHEELTALVRRRKQLVDMLTMEKQNQGKMRHKQIKNNNEKHITQLEEHIKALDNHIFDYANSYPELQEKSEIIISCKGVGKVTAATMIAEMPEIGACSNAEITALAGLAPFNHDSGAMRGTRHIRGGRQSVRNALYMAAISAIRYNPDIKNLYQRLIQKGKAVKLAITACMRQLLITLNSLVKNNRKWKPIYEK